MLKYCLWILLLLPAAVTHAAEKAPARVALDPQIVTNSFLYYHPDLKYQRKGLQAYEKQKFTDALMYFKRAGYYADKPSQGMVAEMLWNGQGAPSDHVQAYVWMDLAAERGYEGFLQQRELYWSLLTPEEQIRVATEGAALYADYGDAAAKPRIAKRLRMGRADMTGSRTGFTGNPVTIVMPGRASGQHVIDGSRLFSPTFWDSNKYSQWQDSEWMKPRNPRVSVGDVEQVPAGKRVALPETRVPQTAPNQDSQEPGVPEDPDDAPPAALGRPG